MIHHYIDAVNDDGVQYVESTIELKLFRKTFCLSKKRWAISVERGAGEHAKRSLHMTASIYLPMFDGETQEDAEDRLIDLVDSTGAHLVGWKTDETEVVDWETEE